MKMAGQNNGKQGGQQQDVNQLLKVRREKLANLQDRIRFRLPNMT